MHDKGWVHRDVKPENVIVNKTKEVRLIDYALAKKIPDRPLQDVRRQAPSRGNA